MYLIDINIHCIDIFIKILVLHVKYRPPSPKFIVWVNMLADPYGIVKVFAFRLPFV